MATYSTNLATVSLCDAVTGWSELSSPHASGSSPASTTENFIHNDNAVDQGTGQADNQDAGIEFDYGSNITWTAASNWVISGWIIYASPTNLKTWSVGGVRIGIGSAADTHDLFNAMGNDFGNYPYGGWQNTAIDPEFATPDQTISGGGAGTYRYIAVLPNITTKITKGSPLAVDAWRYGRHDLVATGTAATFTGMATANDANTARWGVFQSKGGTNYSWKGLLSLGTASTSVTFSDSNKNIQVEDTPRILAGFNAIEIRNTGSSVTWNSINITGVETSITGSAPVSAGDIDTIDNATVSINKCSISDIGAVTFNAGTNPNTVTDCSFIRCHLITQGGATITGSTIDSSENSIAMDVDDVSEVTNNTFISDGTGHAVDLGTFATTTSITWNNELDDGVGSEWTGTTGDPITTGSTGNEAILCNVGTGEELTITVSAGATIPTVKNDGSGTVVVQANQVTLSLTGLIANSEVRIYSAGTTTELDGVENSSTSFDYIYTYVAATNVDIVIHKADYKYIRIDNLLLGAGDASIPIQQIFDRNYNNP